MPRWWIAVGPPEHWQVAFDSGNIWGVVDKKASQWEELSSGDYVLFYVTKPVSGVIGYGVVRAKFKQLEPLWPREVEEKKVIWPCRFEFDVEYCLPRDKWSTHRVTTKYISAAARGGFSPVREDEAQKIVQRLVPRPPERVTEREAPVHEQVKDELVQLGKLQGFIAESEYDMDGERLDVTWRRVEKGSPTYVFEVHISGDIHRALAKLKHAHDLWNSKIFLVTAEDNMAKVQHLLSGTFHEIKDKIRVIETNKIDELFKLKKAYKDLERQLGIS